MTDGADRGDGEGLDYAESGVDIAESETATAALLDAVGSVGDGAYAGLVDLGDQYLGISTDGVGTKLLVAAAVGDYSTVGIDCIAMNVNDLIAEGIEPLAFVDYLAVDTPDEGVAEQLGRGLAAGATAASVELVGGETAVVPEIVTGLDLAGTAVGVSPRDAVFTGGIAPGHALVGWPSSGVHSNGLTLARKAVSRAYEYSDPCPGDLDRSVGEALLEPTVIYRDLLEPMRDHGVRGAAHLTGGGWTNLQRLGDHRYVVGDPWPAQPVFDLVQETGGVSDVEMHRTFNMGTGFVAAIPPAEAADLAEATDGRVLGRVEPGEGVAIRGLEL